MKIIEGDLIELALRGEFDVIIHGCNCFCNMGAGIAATIKYAFPEAYQADLKTLKGDKAKLGTFSDALVKRDDYEITIINAYSQYHWRGRGVKADYVGMQKIFSEIQKRFSGKRIGYPLIGAGLAGGDWNVISLIIDRELEGEDHTLVKYSPT